MKSSSIYGYLIDHYKKLSKIVCGEIIILQVL